MIMELYLEHNILLVATRQSRYCSVVIAFNKSNAPASWYYHLRWWWLMKKLLEKGNLSLSLGSWLWRWAREPIFPFDFRSPDFFKNRRIKRRWYLLNSSFECLYSMNDCRINRQTEKTRISLSRNRECIYLFFYLFNWKIFWNFLFKICSNVRNKNF